MKKPKTDGINSRKNNIVGWKKCRAKNVCFLLGYLNKSKNNNCISLSRVVQYIVLYGTVSCVYYMYWAMHVF